MATHAPAIPLPPAPFDWPETADLIREAEIDAVLACPVAAARFNRAWYEIFERDRR